MAELEELHEDAQHGALPLIEQLDALLVRRDPVELAAAAQALAEQGGDDARVAMAVQWLRFAASKAAVLESAVPTLTSDERSVLMKLSQGYAAQSGVRDALGWDAPKFSRVVGSLRRKGLVDQAVDASDARARTLGRTLLGERLLTQEGLGRRPRVGALWSV